MYIVRYYLTNYLLHFINIFVANKISMATQTKENYLKAIYFLQQKNKEVSLTELGKVMGVSKPTVNNMVNKLTQNGWVDYQKYKPISLSKKGNVEAALIIRKHRLTEMFLVQIMGFGWEEVHIIAEEMEHLKSDQFFDRMDDILGHPTVDPHGSPIPDKDGNISTKKYLNMTDQLAGTSARLCAINDSSVDLLTLLNEKEIKLGTTFQIVKVETFDKTMIVNYGAYQNVSLSHEVCKRFLIEVV